MKNLVAALAFIALILILLLLFQELLTGGASAEAEYYRAHYDVCRIVFEESRDVCLDLVRDLHDADVHEYSSPGWQWPLPRGDSL